MKLKKIFLVVGISLVSIPVLAIENTNSLTHSELIQKGIEFLVNEEVLPEKEARCLVTSLEKAMVEETFNSNFRYALRKEDPSGILTAPKSNLALPTAKKKRIYRETYDECMNGSISNDKTDNASKQEDLTQKGIDLCINESKDKTSKDKIYCTCAIEAYKKYNVFDQYLSRYEKGETKVNKSMLVEAVIHKQNDLKEALRDCGMKSEAKEADPTISTTQTKDKFEAILSCDFRGKHTTIYSCINNPNTLEIKSGSKYKMYQVHELEELGSQLNDGLHFYLDEKFSIKVKNSANNLLLTLKIYNRATGELIFMKSESLFEDINVTN